MAEVKCYSNADSYVEDYPDKSANYGTSSIIRIGKTDARVYRSGYVKFDFSSYPYGNNTIPISSAIFYFHCNSVEGGTPNHACYYCTSSWTETGINWNNRPSISSSLGQMGTGTGWKTLNITDTVKGWLQGTITDYGLCIYSTAAGNWSTFSSREGSYCPYILINYTPIESSSISIQPASNITYNSAKLNGRVVII